MSRFNPTGLQWCQSWLPEPTVINSQQPGHSSLRGVLKIKLTISSISLRMISNEHQYSYEGISSSGRTPSRTRSLCHHRCIPFQQKATRWRKIMHMIYLYSKNRLSIHRNQVGSYNFKINNWLAMIVLQMCISLKQWIIEISSRCHSPSSKARHHSQRTHQASSSHDLGLVLGQVWRPFNRTELIQ